ncbi:FAD/NAD(P)-binding domain-containing protein [Aspergillus eucalypticola CBS 122712]|uniref:FAD/NAD(P)-binding domain-containing protein n=1 Tax=Aspergillus eucalypticola (strain CBS 122712 / IBT 29274) TaxID=1448314 RepID=A0A317VYU9_ASPEC|nr:FAD/NAD(P)-binding domain-containing protein [Aspergillus eucalypticola CBS 122712]PWY78955.1 FAD/NAD(P)-binding domain-containing protein [Aspergillus eucalypticola CBS 122712]
MSIPENCTVLVIGGGPAGSYAASVLAREGINTVLLEAEEFPRYYIGESLLPSVGYFLDLIDCYDKFSAGGFLRKNGATFEFISKQPGYTDFIGAGGAGNHAWNVLGSEADEILFEYAEHSGATVFDGAKVQALDFAPTTSNTDTEQESQDKDLGRRPVSATWNRKKDGSTSTIHFEYFIDASEHIGLMSNKYMKSRSMALWGYWRGAGTYGPRDGDPYFEAVTDGSGWAWFIPLNDGTVSVGITLKQDRVAEKKRAYGSESNKEFNFTCLQDTPGVAQLLNGADLVSSEIRTAADWSDSATTYAHPFARVAGDAGCFIDPLFSSGVHLAMTGGLSAAVTICASPRGDCTEEEAGEWHSVKVGEAYMRFLLVVRSAMEQIHSREKAVLNGLEETNFDVASDHLCPFIQGTVDAGVTLTREEVDRSVEFCTRVIRKVKSGCLTSLDSGPSGRFTARGAAATYSKNS